MRLRLCMSMFALAALAASATPAMADGPGVGTPTVVTLGDSAISGEAGRWAGNTNGSSSNVDALGSTAYCDNRPTGEAISGCHRSKAAEVAHRRRRREREPRVLGRAHLHARHSLGDDFKPGHRLLQRRAAGARVRRGRCSSTPRRTTSRRSRC